MVVVQRLQQKLKPYKSEDNNDLEIKAILAGAAVLFSGIVFEEGTKYDYPLFDMMATFVLLCYNASFLFEWTYFFLDSFQFRNQSVIKFIEMYRSLI